MAARSGELPRLASSQKPAKLLSQLATIVLRRRMANRCSMEVNPMGLSPPPCRFGQKPDVYHQRLHRHRSGLHLVDEKHQKSQRFLGQ